MSENIDNERGKTFTAQKPMTNPTADAAKLLPCPSCKSEKPEWRRAYVADGKVQTCRDPYHDSRPQPAPPEGEPDDADALAGRILATIHNSNEMDRAAAAKVIADVQQLTEADGWRPIESAPKDGSPFLAFFPGDGQIEMVHWSAALDPANSGDDAWYVYRCEEGWPITGEFTHWRPLPSPPPVTELQPTKPGEKR